MKTCLLAITGSVAAMKAPEIVRRLQEYHFDVHCIVTAAGQEFMAPGALAAVSGNPVLDNRFFGGQMPQGVLALAEYPHLQVAEQADVIAVAPASADAIARLATGRADGVFEAAVLAAKCPVIIAPAMNTGMWEAAATQRNVEILRQRGVQVVLPASGLLACGDEGAGRLPEPVTVASFICRAATEQVLAGEKILITLGGTEEPLDPVRVLSNRSSGKTGIALAKAAFFRGAEVTVIAGSVSAAVPDYFFETVRVQTADEMHQAVQKRIDACSIAVFAAAVADFAPLNYSSGKIVSKKDSNRPISIDLRKNPDIATESGKRKRKDQRFYGFALETVDEAEAVAKAKEKLRRKNLDGIFLNSPENLSAAEGSFLFLACARKDAVRLTGTKDQVARQMLDLVGS